jgi:subtilisin family serine protease
MKKLLLIFVFLLALLPVNSQIVFNISQQAWLNKNIHVEEKILLPVQYSSSHFITFLKENHIPYSAINKNTVLARVTPQEIILLAKNKFVTHIYLEPGKPKPLNDTALIHNNVLPVHLGNNLISPFTGKNILLGFIDTGIDINHPDFKDSLGNTRIYRIWDQNESYDGNAFGYGKIWTNNDINSGSCTHKDPFSYYGHGTQVTGTATGNGRAVNNYTGMAPEAKIVMVASKFDTINWLATVVQSVEYIFSLADSLQIPCVINISAGDYYGSHDGLDLPALLIDSMLKAKNGRAIVCAVGNAGFYPFHIQHNVVNDTTFTWFNYNSSTMLGYGAFFTEAWIDSTDAQNLRFSVQLHQPVNYLVRGSTSFYGINDFLNTTLSDTVVNVNNDTLAIVDFFASYENGRYRLQFHSKQPDSSAYYFSVKTAGTGKADFWSASWLGTSEPESTIPPATLYPPIVKYSLPDTLQTMVSSFSCLPSVITVGNFVNRKKYLDVDSVWQTMPTTVGEIG